MMTIEQRFTVTYAYPVIFCRDLFAPGNELLTQVLARETLALKPYRLFIVMDRGVERNHPSLCPKLTQWIIAHKDTIELAAPIEFLPGNEFVKKHDNLVDKLIKSAYQARIGRKDFFLVIGGGAVQDVAGYVAGIIHRGCHIIRVNTTTLSQGDAGVGVKNGVDYGSAKNYLGTFAPPFAVLNDIDFLPTLSNKDWSNGVAEAIKVAVIKDEKFLQEIESKADALRMRDLDAMAAIVQRSAQLHLEHIAGNGDPFETGASRPLDFGHWSAHRLEAMSCFQLSHGEAVAIGIALDCIYASLSGLLTQAECVRVITLLRNCGLCVWCDELILRGSDGHLGILEGLHQFQEHLGGLLNITLPNSLGQKVEVHEIDEARLERSVEILRKQYA